MQGNIFFVNDEPYCLFDTDMSTHNHEFLKGLDAGFFDYTVQSHLLPSDDPSKIIMKDETYSPLALRLAYHHSLETLFSLIGIFLQAHDCGYAWLPRCGTGDLRSLVTKINDGHTNLLTRIPLHEKTWKAVAASVLAPVPEEHRDRLIEGFAALWERLAGQFNDEAQQAEYYSMKHGFRVQKGGVKISMSLASTIEQTPAGEDMQVIGESKFGSAFFQVEKAKKGFSTLTTTRYGVNWSLAQLVNVNKLIYISIHNVVLMLRLMNGLKGSEECQYLFPTSIDGFEKAWEDTSGLQSFSMGVGITVGKVRLLTKADILEHLRKHGHNG